jgi:hypothetical protein
MKFAYEIEISDLVLNDEGYSFEYVVRVDGKAKTYGTIEDDPIWTDSKSKYQFQKALQKGLAAEMVIDRLKTVTLPSHNSHINE